MCVFNLDYFTVFIILRYWRLFKNLYAHLVRNKTKTICSLYPCLLDKIRCFSTFSPLSGSQGRTEATAAIDIELITQSRGESRLKIITIMKKIPKPWITRLRPAVRIALVTQRKCREPPAGRRAAAAHCSSQGARRTRWRHQIFDSTSWMVFVVGNSRGGAESWI